MSFCTHSQDMAERSFTVVDNVFITQYMPDSRPHCVEVYLYGLALCNAHESVNTIEVMCRALSLTRDDIIAAYTYWEELGLVHITAGEEQKIIYLPIRTDRELLKKISGTKYKSFCREIQAVLTGRMITTTEFNEYFLFLETSFFQPEALVEVARYCVELKDNKINYPYILKIARDFAAQHIFTREAVTEKLSQRGQYGDDVKLILSALKLKRALEYYDREYYEHWTKDYGFTLDVLIAIAKRVKAGGMTKLNALCDEYYKNNLFSIKEIEHYEQNREQLLTLAKEINKQIGVYYQSLDSVVNEYVVPWLNKGYGNEALMLIAKYCFRNNVRTLQAMNSIIERFYKLGLLTVDSINQYTAQILAHDQQIRMFLDRAGLVRNVCANDRTIYARWKNDWNLDDELIEVAADKSVSASNPIAYMNKLLADWKARGLTPQQAADTQTAATAKPSAIESWNDHPQREYTEEELRAMFQSLDDVEV